MKLLAAALLFALPAAAQDRPVTLNITFDAASLAMLQERGELVTKSAYYYGEPSKNSKLEVDEMGRIFLGAEEMTVWPKDQSFAIGGSLAAAPLASVIEPFVNVNVFSARISSDDNLLDCGFVEGPTADLSKKPQVIACKLIGG